MEREAAIKKIEQLYPADSPFYPTAETGKRLLMEAFVRSWRFLPEEVLSDYAYLCEMHWEQRNRTIVYDGRKCPYPHDEKPHPDMPCPGCGR